MSKIIGNTVGMGLPKPNLMQTDPTKGDYVKGKEEFLAQAGAGSGQKVNNPWNGKRWLCIGDSITTEGGVYANVGYGKLISSDLGMELTNIAVSGKTAAWGCEVLDSCAEDYDLITVMLGTNDHGYACPIGVLNDDYYIAGDYTSSGSFYARMQLLVEKLQEKYPKSLIMMLTPIKRTAVNPAYSNIANNDAGYQINTTLKLATEAYRNVVIDVCNYYSVPYVDLYNTIDPRTEANRELYFMSAADGTHPNDLGHALKLAPVIKAGILAHTPYVFPEWGTAEPDNPDAPVDPDEPGEPGGDATAPELIHAYGLGVEGEPIEDTVGDCDMKASGERHGVHCNEGAWNLDRGSSFSLRSKTTRNTRYYRVSHWLHTGARGGMHVMAGNSPYDMTGRCWFGLSAPAGVTTTTGDAVVSFGYYTAHDSTAKSEVRYGSKVVAPGGSVELVLTFDADTSTVRIYQDGEKIIEEVTSVPLAVDGLVVYGNWAAELPTDASLGASPCEYIELYRGVITV